MHLAYEEIETFTPFFGVIKKNKANSWDWEITGAPVPPPEISTTVDRQSAIINCQFYENGAYLIAEQQKPGYKLLINNLRQEYLKGLTSAAHALSEGLEDPVFNLTRKKTGQLTHLEERIHHKVIAAGYVDIGPEESVQKYWKRKSSAARAKPSPRKYKLGEITQFTRRLGVIVEKNGLWYVKILKKTAGNSYRQSRNWQDITLVGMSKTEAIAGAQAQDAPIIVEKINSSQYQIIENHQALERLRGLAEGYQLLSGVFAALAQHQDLALKIAVRSMKELVDNARTELGFYKIKNKPDYYGYEILKWAKADPHQGLHNSK